MVTVGRLSLLNTCFFFFFFFFFLPSRAASGEKKTYCFACSDCVKAAVLVTAWVYSHSKYIAIQVLLL
ncbi:hypothetical protein XELAEV_18026629mg [Xenopus laevis]|uniref:Secreted protein n=1 Tax=Xenopus laevis TaxID=8355 RepID=A0A974HIY0_XENLA|nr:hypothetical protein XELAEV_18026629mg [Xenopus laevis]